MLVCCLVAIVWLCCFGWFLVVGLLVVVLVTAVGCVGCWLCFIFSWCVAGSLLVGCCCCCGQLFVLFLVAFLGCVLVVG